MNRLPAFVFVFLLLFSLSLAESGSGNITPVTLSPDTAVPEKTFLPWRPAALLEADRAVIDTDDRMTVKDVASYPFSAIAAMEFSPSCRHAGWTSTGFLIGPDWLLTAGHCLFCPQCHTGSGSMVLYFGFLGERNYFARYTGSDWHAWVSDRVVSGENYHEEDYAIIRLDERIGDRTGFFGLDFTLTDDDLRGRDFHVTGYAKGILRHGSERVQALSGRFLRHFADTEPGYSGCPVYDDDFRAIAINTAAAEDGSENYAVRITSQLYALMHECGYGKE